jgi:CubicO group peptidase (beta-lactamase class C family)
MSVIPTRGAGRRTVPVVSSGPRSSSIASAPRTTVAAVLAVAALLLVGSGQALAATDAWVARHGLTGAAYQSEFDRWAAAGYRLTSVSGYEVGGSARYAAVWRKTAGPAWQARHGLTAAQYQAAFDRLGAQGYRPVLVNGYSVGGTGRFAAIFHRDDSVEWVARHGLSSTQYQAEFDARLAQGYRLRHVSGYTSGGAERYAAIWERSSGPAWRGFHGLTSAQYQALFDSMTDQGYRLRTVSGFSVGGTDKYAGLFEAGAPHPWAARHDVTPEQYQQEVTDLRLQGYSPVQVGAHAGAAGTRFTMLWEHLEFSAADLQHVDSTVTTAMKASNTVGLSLAISRQGKLVFAKSYGLADREAGTALHPTDRMRVASISKPLTAMEIMRLVELGRLSLGDRVFGKGALLGETYGLESEYKDPRVLVITVQHLLEHTAGGWDNDPKDGTPDPMFTRPELDKDGLIKAVLASTPLERAPGANHEYSNFGYSVLGRIVERLTGKHYEDAVRDDVLAPSGATSLAIGGDTRAERLPGEVAYHEDGTGAEDPYGMRVRRMDAHGGWIASPIDLLRVGVRADGFATVPDLLGAGTMATMLTPTTAPRPNGDPANYGKGWGVNSLPNWWHDGYLPGTQSILVRTAQRYGPSANEEFVWSAATNSTNVDRSRNINLDQLMYDVVGGVKSWPSHDLF